MKRFHVFCGALAIALAVAACQEPEKTTNIKADFRADKTEITIGESVTFTDISEGMPSRWEWSFEGADVQTAVTPNPVVKYSKAGTFGVTLKVTRDGVTDTKECPGFITVNYPGTVIANFSADKTTATDEEDIQFTDLSEGNPTSWEWTFTKKGGNSISSTEQNPKLKLDAGVYTVKLKASSPVANDTKEMPDYINVISSKSVSAAFSADSRTTYAGGSVTFKDESLGAPTAWKWTFEGGNPASSTEKNPTVSYATAGTYKVTLEASSDGKSDTKALDAYVRVVSADKLVAFYPFNGDSKDYGPNGIHASKVDVGDGGTVDLMSESHDGSGYSVYFDSESLTKLSYLRVEDQAISSKFDPSADYSFSMWGKFPEDLGSAVTFFIMGRGSNNTAFDGKNAQVMARFQYKPTAADKNFAFVTRDQLGVNVANWCEYTGKVTNEEWHHFVCISKVVDENRVNIIYIDGEKVIENGVKNHTVQTAPFIIGTGYAFVKNTDNWQYQDRYLGNIDELFVYNRALSEEEVQTLRSY